MYFPGIGGAGGTRTILVDGAKVRPELRLLEVQFARAIKHQRAAEPTRYSLFKQILLSLSQS